MAESSRVLGSLSKLVQELPNLEMPDLIGHQVRGILMAYIIRKNLQHCCLRNVSTWLPHCLRSYGSIFLCRIGFTCSHHSHCSIEPPGYLSVKMTVVTNNCCCSDLHLAGSCTAHPFAFQPFSTQVSTALQDLESAWQHITAGEYLQAAAAAAAARSAAEAAFLHPAVLAQLNFPESHKLGVYMPLFLPISVPLVQGLVGQMSRYVPRRRSIQAAAVAAAA